MRRVITLTLALLLIVLLIIPLCASAEAKEPLVIDEAGLLTEDQIQALQTAAEDLSNRRKIKVVILTVRTSGDKGAEAFADDYYDEHFHAAGNKDGILLLYAVDDHDLYISTAGDMIEIADERKIDDIIDEIIGDIRSGQFNTAFEKYLEKVDQVIQQYQDARKHRLRVSIVIAPIVGLLVGLIPIAVHKKDLTTVRPHNDASDYFGSSDKHMTVTRDIFLYTNTTSRVIQTENRGGSGGGSHSSHSTHVSSAGVTHGGHGRKV